MDSNLARFRERVYQELLPLYCSNPKKLYALEGFRAESLTVADVDARDCMRALDEGLLNHVGHGRYTVGRGTVAEPMFWEGRRVTVPRPITLWLEPVITFAALARLHFYWGWPIEHLANQPGRWAFDFAAYKQTDSDVCEILGEVKKTAREADALIQDLLQLSSGNAVAVRDNSKRKWDCISAEWPTLLWIVGPGGYSRTFHVHRSTASVPSFSEVKPGAPVLRWRG